MSRQMKLNITGVRVRAVNVPLKRPLQTSTTLVDAAALLLIDLQTDGGVVGRSYLFSPGKHNLKPIAALVENMAEMVKGDALAPFDLEKKLRARHSLLGVHNIVLFAMSGIDMAAWDALGQALGQPLARLLGAAPRAIPAYNSKGLGLLKISELASEAKELVGEGFNAIKLRVGRPTAAEDLQAIRAVRKAIGPGVALMVDFNQALSVAEALKRGRMIDAEGGVYWIEEPVRADDFAGCARVARELATPIQIGENFDGPHAMADHFDRMRRPDRMVLLFVGLDQQGQQIEAVGLRCAFVGLILEVALDFSESGLVFGGGADGAIDHRTLFGSIRSYSAWVPTNFTSTRLKR